MVIEMTVKVKAFVDGLEESSRKRVEGRLSMLQQAGRLDSGKMARLHSGLWELRAGDVRILGDYLPNGTFLFAHGLRKKQTVLDQDEVKQALRVLKAAA